eukprot:gene1478-biopygen2816
MQAWLTTQQPPLDPATLVDDWWPAFKAGLVESQVQHLNHQRQQQQQNTQAAVQRAAAAAVLVHAAHQQLAACEQPAVPAALDALVTARRVFATIQASEERVAQQRRRQQWVHNGERPGRSTVTAAAQVQPQAQQSQVLQAPHQYSTPLPPQDAAALGATLEVTEAEVAVAIAALARPAAQYANNVEPVLPNLQAVDTFVSNMQVLGAQPLVSICNLQSVACSVPVGAVPPAKMSTLPQQSAIGRALLTRLLGPVPGGGVWSLALCDRAHLFSGTAVLPLANPLRALAVGLRALPPLQYVGDEDAALPTRSWCWHAPLWSNPFLVRTQTWQWFGMQRHEVVVGLQCESPVGLLRLPALQTVGQAVCLLIKLQLIDQLPGGLHAQRTAYQRDVWGPVLMDYPPYADRFLALAHVRQLLSWVPPAWLTAAVAVYNAAQAAGSPPPPACTVDSIADARQHLSARLGWKLGSEKVLLADLSVALATRLQTLDSHVAIRARHDQDVTQLYMRWIVVAALPGRLPPPCHTCAGGASSCTGSIGCFLECTG